MSMWTMRLITGSARESHLLQKRSPGLVCELSIALRRLDGGGSGELSCGVLIHRHDDLSTSMPLRETAERLGGLAQMMAAVDDRRHFPRLEESGQGDQVPLLAPRHEEDHLLTYEP